MAEQIVLETLNNSLKSIQHLRNNVSRVFDNKFAGKSYNQNEHENSYITQLKQQLININKDLRYFFIHSFSPLRH